MNQKSITRVAMLTGASVGLCVYLTLKSVRDLGISLEEIGKEFKNNV